MGNVHMFVIEREKWPSNGLIKDAKTDRPQDAKDKAEGLRRQTFESLSLSVLASLRQKKEMAQ